MTSSGYEYEVLNGTQISQRFPDLTYEHGHLGLFDPSAGVLLASRVLNVMQVKLTYTVLQ